MKRQIQFMCATAVFVVSATAFADDYYEQKYGLGNVTYQYDRYTDHIASGYAIGDNAWGWGCAEGSKSIHPAYAGDWEPTIFVDAYALAWVSLSTYFQPCYADAEAEGSGYARGVSGGREASAYVDSTMFNGHNWLIEDEDNPSSFYDWAERDWYEADETIEVSHSAVASAGVIQDSMDIAGSTAMVQAIGFWQ